MRKPIASGFALAFRQGLAGRLDHDPLIVNRLQLEGADRFRAIPRRFGLLFHDDGGAGLVCGPLTVMRVLDSLPRRSRAFSRVFGFSRDDRLAWNGCGATAPESEEDDCNDRRPEHVSLLFRWTILKGTPNGTHPV